MLLVACCVKDHVCATISPNIIVNLAVFYFRFRLYADPHPFFV